MKKTALVLLVFLLFTLVCCTDTNNKTSLKICGSYAVPGMFYPDVKGTEADCKILETDSYGRILFEYIAPDNISDKVNTVSVICQLTDKEYVYYYDTLCYQPSKGDNAELKARNDWDKELDITKMTKRAVKTSFDGFIVTSATPERSKIKAMFCDFVGISSENLIDICIDDIDPSGNLLYFAEYSEEAGIKKCFFSVSDNKICDVFQLKDSEVFSPEEYLNFKLSSGWEVYSEN